MRILVVGSGGREHALAWRLAQEPSVAAVFAAPGNPGMARVATCLDVGSDDLDAICAAVADHDIGLTVVGPEAPLVAGLADRLAGAGRLVFGPSAAAARIEGSKAFCREFSKRYEIPMARGESFTDPDEALTYARSVGPPVVVKADGLAAGKGVTVCSDHDAAAQAIGAVMRERVFGAAGDRVVVEECLQGREISLLYLTDGRTLIPLEPAQDYKPIHEGNTGPNTGGMGSYSPAPWLTEQVRERARREIAEPIVAGLAAQGTPYVGCLYTGLFVTDEGPKLIEVNCRFGDPETQSILPRMESGLAEAMVACVRGEAHTYKVSWLPEATVCVVASAPGYPGSYPIGLPIAGIEDAEALGGVTVFHAGTATGDGSALVSGGGRVLNVVARAATIPEARELAYQAAGRIRMQDVYYRRDIAEGVS